MVWVFLLPLRQRTTSPTRPLSQPHSLDKQLTPEVADSIRGVFEVRSKGLSGYVRVRVRESIQPLVEHGAAGCLPAPVQLLVLSEPDEATRTRTLRSGLTEYLWRSRGYEIECGRP